MSANAERKEVEAVATDDGPWVTLNRAHTIMGESREAISRRALLGQIRTCGVAHVVLFHQRDVERIAAEKAAQAGA